MIVRIPSHSTPGAFIAFKVGGAVPKTRHDVLARGRWIAAQFADDRVWSTRDDNGDYRPLPPEVATQIDEALVIGD